MRVCECKPGMAAVRSSEQAEAEVSGASFNAAPTGAGLPAAPLSGGTLALSAPSFGKRTIVQQEPHARDSTRTTRTLAALTLGQDKVSMA